MEFFIGLVIGLVVGGGAMYIFHAKVKKALVETQAEVEKKYEELKAKANEHWRSVLMPFLIERSVNIDLAGKKKEER